MSFTVSFDASQKIKAADVKGVSNHIFRDALDVDLEHSNQDIDPSLTHNNISIYYNQTEQKFKKCTSIGQIQESLQDRLSTVKKPLRKDAVVARGLILQLDPEYFSENTSMKDITKSHNRMLGWAKKTFGEQNLIGISIHLDESNPHMHLLFTPVTDDGRLSQKDWFPDPVSLRQMHEDLRQHMEQEGYDISHDRQPKRKHMSVDEYKTFREAKDKAQELRNWEQDLKQRTTRLNERERALEAEIEAFRLETNKTMQQLEKSRNEALNALEAEKETKFPYMSQFLGANPSAKIAYDEFVDRKEKEFQTVKEDSPYIKKFKAQMERQLRLNESLAPRQGRRNGYDFDL